MSVAWETPATVEQVKLHTLQFGQDWSYKAVTEKKKKSF